MNNGTTTHTGQLSETDIAKYWEDGFLCPIPVLPQDEAADLRQEFEGIEAEWRDNGLPLPLNTYKRVNAHCVMPIAARLAGDERILDVVEGVLGPDILIYSAEFFIKEPRTKQIVSMHQDLTYWGLGEIDGLVTAWLALSPATRESGCMDFVRGSHKNPILPHEDTFGENNLLSRGQEIQVDVAEEDKVTAALQPGELSLHHGLMIHGSGPNTSDDRRIALVVRYCRPEIKQQVAERDYAILARGVDRFGNFALFRPPEQPFSPRSLALYDEIRSMQAQAVMAGTKDKKGLYA